MISLILFLLSGFVVDNITVGILLAFCVLTKDLALPVVFAVFVDIGKQISGTVVGSMNFGG